MTFLLICLILMLVFGWHFIFALLGGVLIIGALGIFIAIASIVLFCIAVVLILTLPGAVGVIIGVIFALWTLVAIVLAPVLFPIVLPLFIIFAFLVHRQRNNKKLPYKPLDRQD